MKKIAGKVTDIDFFSQKSTLPTCPIELQYHKHFDNEISFPLIYLDISVSKFLCDDLSSDTESINI